MAFAKGQFNRPLCGGLARIWTFEGMGIYKNPPLRKLVAGEGFEPSKAEPGDLQSPPIGRSGNPPRFTLRRHSSTS